MKTTPKDFFLWLGAVGALYASLIALVNLLFEYINYAYPDELNSYVDPFSGVIRFAMATLIVLTPVAIILMHLIRKSIVQEPARADLWVRKWALVLTLFLAGGIVIIDLITLINYFLGGDLTTRFILKVLVVLLVVGGVFLHYVADLRGYWKTYPHRARLVGWGAGVVVLVSIASGFVIIGSPSEIRELRLDQKRVHDLQSIQWQIVNYWQQGERMPQELADLEDPLVGFAVPTDPETKEAYEYALTGTLSFELCATFTRPSQQNPRGEIIEIPSRTLGGGLVDAEYWEHEAGRTCFTRTIDPDRFPPVKE